MLGGQPIASHQKVSYYYQERRGYYLIIVSLSRVLIIGFMLVLVWLGLLSLAVERLFWPADCRLLAAALDDWALAVRVTNGAAGVVFETEFDIVAAGSGMSFVRDVWLSVWRVGSLVRELLYRGIDWLEAACSVRVEVCGFTSTKTKQNAATISSGGPIRKRCELVICPVL